MKAKTIRQVIRRKVDDWLDSIEDVDLREQLKGKVIVTGGAIASMLLRERVSDYDVYLRDRDACVKVARYYVDRFKPQTAKGIPCRISVDETLDGRVSVVIKSAGVASEGGTDREYEYFETFGEDAPRDAVGEYVSAVMDDPGEIQDTYDETERMALATGDEDGKPRYRPIFMSSNAITLSNQLQIVTRFYGEPNAIHENYDFVHCTNYWKSWGPEAEQLTLRQDALEALLTRELRYVGSKYPICSLIRVRKFVGRGWTINAGQILKMAMQVSSLDLTNWQVLRDQLTGVDAAYFCEVLAKLKERDPDKINGAYLVEIIDRMY